MPEQLPIAGPMLGAALTVAGLIVSWVVWRRRGPAAGLRGIAWSLIPLAAGLMGLMAILWGLAADLAGFFAGLVFNPVVWAGVAVAALAVVLWVVSGVMRSRGVGTRGRAAAPRGAAGPKATAPRGAAPPIAAPGPAAGRRPAPGTPAGRKDDDLDDIEALLRKHGIE
ncbi:cellulose synthase [Nocardiopsis trehalosi]|uniref:cellulose synthase n=1 Tax=Nocardiopsis trehalosi TaxID=109329 RepID=UPI001FE1C791|nr:cellulose synthase [Nocardiopsis trehalosi]